MTTTELGPTGAGEHRSVSIGRWALGAVGVVGVVVGAVLVLQGAPSLRELISVATWLLVPAVVSDLVIMPVAALVAGLCARRLPAAWRAPVIIGLVLSTFVVLIGWPFIGGFGRHADNPSLLDRNYLGGALALLAVVWSLCLLAGLVSSARARPRRDSTPGRRAHPCLAARGNDPRVAVTRTGRR